MTRSWSDVKGSITSISDEEKREIERLARLSSLISQRRRMLGLTQEEVARRTGLTQANIARIEKAKTVPKTDTLLKIADALGLEVTLVPHNMHEEAAAASSLSFSS